MKRIPVIAVVLLCLLTVLWRLDGVPLWRDEATTAVWGRQMATQGSLLPYVYDHKTQQLLVQDDDGHDINSRLLPAMQSYMQFYVSALGHRLLGDGTFQSRLPFALIGLATLFVLYQLGILLFGPCWLALMLPVSASVSIYFLHAARQGRYYILVVFAVALLLWQMARYVRSTELAKSWVFFIQLALIGCLLYSGNYLSFAATWLVLGLFFLLTDRPALLRLCGVSVVLAIVLGIEFWMLHSEYLTEWKPGNENTFWENFRYITVRRGGEFWRWVPFVILVPAAVLLFFLNRSQRPAMQTALGCLAAVVPFTGIFIDESWLRRASDPTFVLFGMLFLAVPGGLLYLWTRLEKPDPQVRMALLCGLILVVCPLFTVAVAGRGTLPRYYSQCCPAAVVLIGLAVAGLHGKGRNWLAVSCLIGASLWPNLDLAGGGTEQVILRQFLKDDSYNRPVLEYLAENTRQGESIAYYRNVKGMGAYYYFPDRRWVNLLDSNVEYNRRFRGKISADQFDDAPGPDWFVLWDTRDLNPKMLDDRYLQVWEYSYIQPRSVWDMDSEPRSRGYQIFRKR